MSVISYTTKIIYFLSFICVILNKSCHGEVFSSVHKLQNLARNEGRLLQAFKDYKDHFNKRGEHLSDVICAYYAELNPVVTKSSTDKAFAENPINVLHLLNRLLNTWPLVFKTIVCHNCNLTIPENEFNTTYTLIQNETDDWPTEYDLHSALRSFLRLRITYQLPVNKLLQGIIYNEHTDPLTSSLIELILFEAEDLQMYDEVMTWCDVILSMLPTLTLANSSRTEMDVKQVKARIYSKAGFNKNAANLLREYSITGTLSVKENLKYYEDTTDEDTGFVDEWPLPLSTREEDSDYMQLCRGAKVKPSEEISRLSCYLSNTKIPYYKAKAEEMNLDPRIIVFHDVISVAEMNFLKKEGSKVFSRSGIQNKGLPTKNDDEFRVSFTGWVLDGPDPDSISRKLSVRVGLISGLDTTYKEIFSSSEAFQVVNYGIGGMFNVHRDNLYHPYWGPSSPADIYYVRGSGDRIATWMFYINDVRAGGATIFPRTNTRIPVIKGAAAFWYNLLPNGEIDDRVFHGGCPVLLGSKWISNKWIRESGQMFRRPCALKYDATV